MLRAKSVLDQRFWSKVQKTDGCWLWTASTNGRTGEGYGKFQHEGRLRYAHVLAYEEAHGPVADGWHVDHVVARGCLSTLCVNPAHLEAVPPLENVARALAHNKRKTHCPLDHEYDATNTDVRPDGARRCRECHRAKERERYAARQR